MSRRKKPENEKVTQRVSVWMNELDKDYTKAQAALHAMSVNEYLTALMRLDRAGFVKWPRKEKL